MDVIVDIIKKLREMAILASQNAYAPYSDAHIGSSLLTEDGSFFSGCNVENSSYGGTVCSERVAIFNAVSSGHKKISKLYVYSKPGWPPCGMCRQVIGEFATSDMEIIVGDEHGSEQRFKFWDIFPHAFVPGHLGKS